MNNNESADSVHLMMIDDDSEDIFLLRRAIAESGINVRLSGMTNPEKFLAMLDADRASAPDGILLDLNMPQKSGHDVLLAIRKVFTSTVLPVFVLTTTNQPAERERMIDEGADAFMTKPVTWAGLTDLISQLSERLRLHGLNV